MASSLICAGKWLIANVLCLYCWNFTLVHIPKFTWRVIFFMFITFNIYSLLHGMHCLGLVCETMMNFYIQVKIVCRHFVP